LNQIALHYQFIKVNAEPSFVNHALAGNPALTLTVKVNPALRQARKNPGISTGASFREEGGKARR